jgi:phage terminase small subunit
METSSSIAMPTLRNARHERFAQELAIGKTADAAYVLAGYRANRSKLLA